MSETLRKQAYLVAVNAVAETDSILETLKLPLVTLNEVNDIEEKLKSDKVFRTAMVTMLSRIGGRDAREAVRNCLYHLIEKELAVQFSYFGRKGKLPFEKTELKGVLVDAILRTTGFADPANEASVKNAAMDWFKYAKDQKGGRKNRKEPLSSSKNNCQDEISSVEGESLSSDDSD